MGGMDDTARGCGLAVLVLVAVLSIPGLYAVHKLAPCVTGEVTTTTAATADGQILTATAPVCPEEGQTYTRAVGLGLLWAASIVLAVLGTLAFNGLENVGLGWISIARDKAPIKAAARDITPDSSRDYERHQMEMQYKQALADGAAMRAELDRLKVDDRKGWQALPADRAVANGAGASNGNGHKGGGSADLSGFEVLG